MAAAVSALSKMGIKPEMIAKAVPYLSGYLKKYGTAALGSLLGGLFRRGSKKPVTLNATLGVSACEGFDDSPDGLGNRHRPARQPVNVDMHETTERARCLLVVAKQRNLVDDARSAQPLHREPGVYGVGEARGAEELAARFRHDANGRQFADVDTACLDQEPVHGGIEVRIVGHVVDVAIVVVIDPARGYGAEEPEIRPAMMGDVGHDGGDPVQDQVERLV